MAIEEIDIFSVHRIETVTIALYKFTFTITIAITK